MRTTLNIEDDVLLAAKERAQREHSTAGKIISDLARQALTGRAEGAQEAGSGEGFCGFKPLPRRGQAVSNSFINRLREQEPE